MAAMPGSTPRAARQAGRREGHAGRAAVASTTASRTSSTGDVFRAAVARGHADRARGRRLHGPRRARPRRDRDRRGRRALRRRRSARATASSSTASRARWCRPRSSSGCSPVTPSISSLDLDVPTEIVLDRIAGRRVCVNCGATYHVDQPPKDDWTCDVCGGHVVQRDDDTEEAVMRRLELYERQTLPIIAVLPTLGEAGRASTASASGDEVQERLVKAIDGRFEPAPRVITRKNAGPDRADAAGRQGRRRDARGVHPRRQAGCDHARRRPRRA